MSGMMMAAAGAMLSVAIRRSGPTRYFDLGTIETAVARGSVVAKRSPSEYGVVKKTRAAIARLVRAIFNYAPASTKPYQLRLSWMSGDVAYTGWLSVPREVYDRTAVGDAYGPLDD